MYLEAVPLLQPEDGPCHGDRSHLSWASGGNCAECLGQGLYHVSTVWNAFYFGECVNETMTSLLLSAWQSLWGPYCDSLEALCIVASSSGVVLASGLMAHTVHAFLSFSNPCGLQHEVLHGTDLLPKCQSTWEYILQNSTEWWRVMH